MCFHKPMVNHGFPDGYWGAFHGDWPYFMGWLKALRLFSCEIMFSIVSTHAPPFSDSELRIHFIVGLGLYVPILSWYIKAIVHLNPHRIFVGWSFIPSMFHCRGGFLRCGHSSLGSQPTPSMISSQLGALGMAASRPVKNAADEHGKDMSESNKK